MELTLSLRRFYYFTHCISIVCKTTSISTFNHNFTFVNGIHNSMKTSNCDNLIPF